MPRMQTPVLLPGWPLDREPAPATPRPVRLRDRAAARLFAFRLDTELADGADPGLSPAHRLRAHRLRCQVVRARLARSLNAVARDARTGRRRMTPVTPRRAHVRGAESELHELAHRLVSPDPVSARGVAQASVLLADGTGPLYENVAPGLREALRRAAASL
jgi:hypothetical protein